MSQLKLFIELTRLKKPIGFMLLFWPCNWGLTIVYDFNSDLNVNSKINNFNQNPKTVLKSVFLLGIILSTIVFTPFAFGQELKKATWLESISVVYDQKFTKSIQSSVAFETINNNEIQF